MSDILIKNMEMPKNCCECPLTYYEDGACIFTGIEALSIGIQNDCPLIEVPTPHGRLIDADALSERIEEQRNTEYAMKNRPVGTWKRVLELPLDMISDAPTIIKAEEAEDG